MTEVPARFTSTILVYYVGISNLFCAISTVTLVEKTKWTRSTLSNVTLLYIVNRLLSEMGDGENAGYILACWERGKRGKSVNASVDLVFVWNESLQVTILCCSCNQKGEHK